MAVAEANPREDFERARRLYAAYQQHRTSGAATPFRPDPEDVAAFQRTYARYQEFQRGDTAPAAEPRHPLGRIGDELIEGGKEFMLGLGETGTNLVRGVGALGRQAGLLDAERGLTDLIEGREGRSGLERWADATESEMRGFYDPDSDARFARFGGRLIGEGATALGGSKVILSGLSKMPATSKLATRIAQLQGARAAAKAGGLARGAAMLKRIGGQVAPVVPLDIAIGAGQAEEGENPLLRGLEEVAYDVGGTTVFDALGTALRSARLARVQRQRAARTPTEPAPAAATETPVEPPAVPEGATPELATLSRKASEILDRGALVTGSGDIDVLRRALEVGGDRLDPSLRQRIEYRMAEVGDAPTGYPTHFTPAGGTRIPYAMEPEAAHALGRDPAQPGDMRGLQPGQPGYDPYADASRSPDELDDLTPVDQEVILDPTTGQETTVKALRHKALLLPQTDHLVGRVERQPLYDEILQQLRSGRGWSPEELAQPLPSGRTKAEVVASAPPRPAGEPKILHLVLGLPGAGKSSVVVDRLWEERPWAVALDSDEAKRLHPEVMGGLNANGVHAESSHIRDALRDEAIVAGDELIIPTIGQNPDRIRGELDAYARLGYQVRVYLNDVAPEEAMRRVVERARSSGRFVDPKVAHVAGGNPVRSYELAKGHPATVGYERWDNNAAGQPARLIERGEVGGQGDRSLGAAPTDGPAPAGNEGPGLGQRQSAAGAQAGRGVDGVPADRGRGRAQQREPASAGGPSRTQAAPQEVDLFNAPPPGGAQRPLSTVERAVATAEETADAARRANAARADADAASAAPGVVLGREATVKAESGQASARYAAVPAHLVIASHNPVSIGDFAPNRLHPGNERGYGRGTAQREGVVRNALRWDPDRVLNNNPTPAEGPPMVAAWTRELADEYGVPWAEVEGKFFALGGNSRVMTQQLMRDSGRRDEIGRAVSERAAQFGLDPAALPADPMIVRVVDGVRTRADVERLVRQFNETGTKALSQEESAVTFGARISDETMRYLGDVLDPERTVLAALQDPTVSRELRSRFLQDGVIDPATRDRYFTRHGTLTDEGKLFVKGALLGRAVPDRELLQTAAPSVVDKIERIAASVALTSRAGPPYDLRPALADILRRQAGKPVSLDSYLAQLDMLDEPPGEQVQSLWLALNELPAKELRERMARYSEVLQKRVVRDVDPNQAGFDLGAELPPPTPKEAWDAAFVQMPETPRFTTMGEAADDNLFASGGAYAGSLLGGLQGVKPDLARWLVRGTLGGMAGIAATNEDVDPKVRASLMLAAVVLGGPAVRKALAKTGLHPGEALWRIMSQGGAAAKDALFRRIAGTFGEGEAYRVMQFLSYEYGLPEWLSRARVAREVGIENTTRRMIDYVRRDLVAKLSAADREKVTGIVRQVEQRRALVTQEIERLQGLLHTLRTQGPGSLQQSNLFRPADPTDQAGLLSALQQQRTLRDTETARAWLDQSANPLAAKAKKLVDLEDQLADNLIAEGYDPAIFERFRGAHLTRAFEKYLDPEQAPEGLADALRDPMAAGATRDPAYWSVARQDLPPDVLKDLGEINDAAVLFAKGQADKLHSLFTRRYFNELLSGFARDGLPMMADKAVKASYIQLPATPSLGPLAGKFAHPSIAHSLLATYGPQGHASQIWRAWKRTTGKMLGWWKAGKTAWSPWTQARNMMSNAVMLHLSGMDLFDPRSWATLTRALHDYRNKGKLYQEAADAGVFRGSFWKGEVEDLFRAWSGVGAGVPIARLAALAGTAPKLQRALRKPSDLYEATEHVFKLAKYAHERAGGASATQAADEAVRTLFDYSAVPGWVRAYRSSIFGAPFFTFTYKAVPRMAEWTLRHPDKVASLMAVFALVETLGGEKEPLPEVAPELVHPWLRPFVQLGKDNLLGKPGVPFTGRQSLQLPFKTEKGQALASLDFLLPSGSAVPDAPTAEGGLWESIPPALRPGNPLGTLPFELLRNRALYSNKPIRPEAAARDGVVSNALRYYLPYLMRQLAPGAVQLAVDYNADEGIKPGLAVSAAKGDLPVSALAAQLAGVKPVFMDPQRSALIETQKLDRAIDEVQRQARREMFRARQEGDLDEGEREGIRERARERRRSIQGDRRAVAEALRRARAAGY